MSVIGPRPQLVRDMVFMTDEQRMRHVVTLFFKRIINDNINILQNERCKHEKNNTNN